MLLPHPCRRLAADLRQPKNLRHTVSPLEPTWSGLNSLQSLIFEFHLQFWVVIVLGNTRAFL
jgi:hypothetical protein